MEPMQIIFLFFALLVCGFLLYDGLGHTINFGLNRGTNKNRPSAD